MNPSKHIHPPNPDAKFRAIISKTCKDFGQDKPYETAGVVVEEVIKNKLDSKKIYPILKMQSLRRAVNRLRQKKRPKCPTQLDSPLLLEHIPQGFLRADIHFEGQRHLIFATDKQISVREIDTHYNTMQYK